MSAILAGLSAGVVLASRLAELARARRRIARWPLLPMGDDDARTSTAVAMRSPSAPDVAPAVAASAARFLDAERLDALDLIPAALRVSDALELASIVDAEALRTNPFARTAGAGALVVAQRALVERAGVTQPRDSADVAESIERLRRFAVGRTGVAITDAVAPPPTDVNRATMLRARTGINKGPRLYVEGIWWALLFMTVAADWRVAIAAAVVLSLAPSFVFLGLALQPRDQWTSVIVRMPSDFLRWLAALLERDPHAEDAANALRPTYEPVVRAPAPVLLGDRRSACPLCGSPELRRAVSSGDVVQRKPGRFTMDRCTACGIVFQNPPLSPAGLDFYYRDFYDGLGADSMDEVFASTHGLYEKRVDSLVAEGLSPARWLDVGCGYAHFSLAARRRLPQTSFEGLDRSESVNVGVSRGWLDRAWRQSAGEVSRTGERFDVVSMFHLLEHTTDPAAEITAASRLLAPGGRLVIEIPNPHCRLGGLLRRWWFPWFQPQHQFLLNESAVRRLVADAGLAVTKVEYLMTTGDFLLASMLAVRSICAIGDVPWAPPPGVGRRVRDAVVWSAAMPLFAASIVADAVYNALPASPRTSNAFRLTAAAP